jgi:hypothetical protein
VEDIFTSFDQQTQDLCKELDVKVDETHLGLEAVMKDLHEELDLRIVETQKTYKQQRA